MPKLNVGDKVRFTEKFSFHLKSVSVKSFEYPISPREIYGIVLENIPPDTPEGHERCRLVFYSCSSNELVFFNDGTTYPGVFHSENLEPYSGDTRLEKKKWNVYVYSSSSTGLRLSFTYKSLDTKPTITDNCMLLTIFKDDGSKSFHRLSNDSYVEVVETSSEVSPINAKDIQNG